MILVYLGFASPIGKLSFIYMVIPAQIAYFSLFQYDQIPITFSGFGNLLYSNGFNQLNSINDNNQSLSNLNLKGV